MLSKRAKTRRRFRKTVGANNSVQFQVFKIAKFEFKANSTHGLWGKHPVVITTQNVIH